jgi:hypothetical protein
MGYVEPHIFVEGDFTDLCNELRESNIYLLHGVSFSYLDKRCYFRDSGYYFGLCGALASWFEKKESLREWSVMRYDSQTLKRDVAAQLKVEGTPLGIIDTDVTEMCSHIETPLLGQRRITMDLFKFYYPDGVRAACYRNFRGIPFVLWLEGLGVYYVVDDYLMLLPFDRFYSQEKGFWGCKCPMDAYTVYEMEDRTPTYAEMDGAESRRLNNYGLCFWFNGNLDIKVAWAEGSYSDCTYRFRGDLSEVESWGRDFSE